MTPQPESCAPGAESRAPRPDRQHAWETGTLAWDSFYLLVFVAVLIIVVASTPGSTAVASGAMGAMIAWYLFVGRPLWAGARLTAVGARLGRAWAGIYLTGLFALFFVVQSQNPEAWFLAFALSPQFFSIASGRTAMYLGIALNLTAAALLVARYPTGGTGAVAFAVAAAGSGFAIFYGGWVSRIIGQSAERAEIIDQLEATRAELAAAQHTAGRLAERQKLAADIHDTLAQGFASIVMLIQAAQADLDGSPSQAAHSQAARHLDLAARTARENLAEARALVAGLTPAQLAGGTLPDALRRLSQASVVDATFGVDGTPRPLPMAIEVVLLRVCQEALSNVGKHAHAQSATVRLEYDPDSVRLEVGDDGDGFDPASVCDGFGLRGMRARVTEAGGTLTVGSEPGAGTRVSAMVPA
jgi:signal transduction histidine kinase